MVSPLQSSPYGPTLLGESQVLLDVCIPEHEALQLDQELQELKPPSRSGINIIHLYTYSVYCIQKPPAY